VLACSLKQEQMNTAEQGKPLCLRLVGHWMRWVYIDGDGASFCTANLSLSVLSKNR
jgi:hypothetical protein